MHCLYTACRELYESKGVSISYTNNQTVGSIATYSCFDHISNRTCDAMTGWDNDEPLCGEPDRYQ